MSDRILFSIGEALVDMIPSRVGCSFDEVPAFSPRVGGAPANVCAAAARLGGRSALLSQLGDDPFGHKIARALAGCGVELSHLEFTSKASTALAFVSLAENGERTFSFCRKPSADLLYAPEQIDPGWFSQAFALHFCSVSLVDSPMRYAHLAAITAAREAGAILSFDPNLRFPLWPDREQLRQTVWQFLPLTHILKLSDEELPFLTGAGRLPRPEGGREGHHRRGGRLYRLVFVAAAAGRGDRRRTAKAFPQAPDRVSDFFQPLLRYQRAAPRCHRQLSHLGADGAARNRFSLALRANLQRILYFLIFICYIV